MLHPSAYLVPQYKTSSEPLKVSKNLPTNISTNQQQYYQKQDVPTARNQSLTNGSKSIPIPQTNSNGMDQNKSMTLIK